MSRFDRYMLSQLLVLFGFFALVLVAVYWVNRALSLFDGLIADGQSLLVFLELSALTLPNVVRVVLPVAGFAAAVYVTNRLMNDSELLVMQATGFSPWRLARPVAAFGVLVALLLAVLIHALVPASRSHLAQRSAEISENIAGRFLTEGRFLHPVAGVTLYVRQITPEGGLRDIYLSDARERGRRIDYTAREAYLVPGGGLSRLVMLDGLVQEADVASGRLATTSFDSLTYDLSSLIAAGGLAQIGAREAPTAVLWRADPADIAAANSTEAEFRLEFHTRIAQPLLAGFAAISGFAALLAGGFSRFGVMRQVLGAVALLIVAQVINNAAAGLALADIRLAWLAYAPVAFVAAAALGLLIWSGRTRRVAPPGNDGAVPA